MAATVCWKNDDVPTPSADGATDAFTPSASTPQTCADAVVTAAADDGSSAVVRIPETMPDDAAATVSVGGSAATPLNAAQAWWHLGSERGNTTAPGGWLRVFGVGLAFGGARGCAAERPSSSLRRSSGGVATLTLTPLASSVTGTTGGSTTSTNAQQVILRSENATCYAAFFRIPEATAVGGYTAIVTNDIVGTAPAPLPVNVVVNAAEPWPSSLTVDVTAGDTAGLIAALARVGAAGGGVVRVASGVTAVGPATLVVPNGVTLCGVGSTSTILKISDGGEQSLRTGVLVGTGGGGRARLTDLTVTAGAR